MATNNYDPGSAEASRRSFMRTAAIATGALVLGTGASSDAAATDVQQDQEAVLFSTNFFPQQEFDVVARLEQGTTVNLLQVDEETVPEISQPDEWNGHVVRYDMGTETSGVTTFLFLRDTALDPGDSATFTSDASVYSPQLNLLNVSIEAAESDAEEPETEDESGAEDEGDDTGEEETDTTDATDDEAETENETDDGEDEDGPVNPCENGADRDFCR